MPLLVAAVAVALAACDSFRPRDAEEPEEAQPIILLTEPDSVYIQMQIAIESKFISSYMNCFDQEFEFTPDTQDAEFWITQTGNAELFDDWDRGVEEQVHTLIFGRPEIGEMELVFTGAATDSSGDDVLINFWKPYQLTVGDSTFAGLAFWEMRKSSGEWRLTRWDDNRAAASGLPSWTSLRGANR